MKDELGGAGGASARAGGLLARWGIRLPWQGAPSGEALERARERRIIENAFEGIWEGDAEGVTTFANRRLGEILGLEQRRIIGRKSFELLAPKMSASIETGWRECRVGRSSVRELEIWRLDGQRRRVLVSVAPLFGAAGHFEGACAFVTDLTHIYDLMQAGRRDMEEQVRQAMRMESVGRLAGGVAHDFNNILTVILGQLELMEGRPGLDGRTTQGMKEIKDAALRAATLVHQLLTFARKSVVNPKRLDLNEVLTGSEPMLKALAGEDTQLILRPSKGLPPVMADPTQTGQVLVNIVSNAREGMPLGGTLTISTETVDLDAVYCAQHPDSHPGPHVLLTASDTGRGMDPEEALFAFEPFYSAKTGKRGSGLGLPMVYGIVRQAGGHVTLATGWDKGMTFKIYLPVASAQAASTGGVAQLESVPGPEGLGLGSQSVLVCEDEAPVLAVLEEGLRRFGYDVRATRVPAEAIAWVRGGMRPALLVTDVVMPGLSGDKLAEELCALLPGLKVIFVSGYSASAVAQHGVLMAGANFIQKPFTLTHLAATVASVLGPPPPGQSAVQPLE